MAEIKELIERVNRIDEVCMRLRYRALGLDMSVEDFIGEMETNEININLFLEFSVEVAKGGYGLSEHYTKRDELIFRYFTMVALLMTYLAFPSDKHTFTTMSYLCELFDEDFETFMDFADRIQSEVFDKYLEKLEMETIYLISSLRDTFELLLIAYVENHTPQGIIDEISNVVYSDINNYMENNSYDILLTDIMKNQ